MLEYNVEWSRDALDDLDYYWGIVLEESRDPDTAEAFVNRMIDYAEECCRRPYNGCVVDVLNNENIREFYYHGYTILYEIVPEIVSVIIHEIYSQKQMHIRTYKRDRDNRHNDGGM